MFEARVDGVVSAELGLHGKPEPDIFTTACDMVKADYAKSIVVEDLEEIGGIEGLDKIFAKFNK